MNIGIVGAGKLGTGLAKRLVAKAHAVMLSFSRDFEKLKSVAETFGGLAGTLPCCVEFADVVVLATPWSVTPEVLSRIDCSPSRKVLWDCTNALKPDMSSLEIGTTTSAGEVVAKLAPWARAVKAIPPFAEVLHSPSTSIDGIRPSVFVCGDDLDARGIVAALVEDIGASPVDAGPLSLSRYTEPAAMLLVNLAYLKGFGPRVGLTFVSERPQSNHGSRAS